MRTWYLKDTLLDIVLPSSKNGQIESFLKNIFNVLKCCTFKLLEDQAESMEKPNKKRKLEMSTKTSAKDAATKLFEEHLEW